jgi:hypothetical protein
MAVTSGQLIVGQTRLAVDGVSTNPYRLHFHNNEATTALYLGGPDVTVNNGLRLEAHETLEMIVSPNSQIFIVSTSNNHEVSWLRMDV